MTSAAIPITLVAPSQLSLFGAQPAAASPPSTPSAPLSPARPNTAVPFLKWAGSKRKLVQSLLSHVPSSFGTYHEPFLGGGALFFALPSERAVLSDKNERLIRTYLAVRDDVEGVIALLKGYPNEKGFYMRMRAADIDSQSDAEVAAWFIFMNKTCFNGLYRVNTRNKFNVPFGDNPTATICDEPNLRACSAALQGVEILHQDFAAVVGRAAPGDVVYFDPPYAPISATSSFTGYAAGGFSVGDQRRLRDVAVTLKARGVQVIISNSNTPGVRSLYANGFTMATVNAARTINAQVGGRGKVAELIIT